MRADPVVEFIVRQASSVLSPGGGASLVGVENGVALVRFKAGVNSDCQQCTVSPEDFREYLKVMLIEKATYVTDIHLQVDS